MKKEIFNRIIDCVSTITEIDKEEILSSKKNSEDSDGKQRGEDHQREKE